MEKFTVIGIDPGAKGAIAAIDQDGRFLDVIDMPIVSIFNTKIIDHFEFYDFAGHWTTPYFCVELVNRNFKLGINYGSILSTLYPHKNIQCYRPQEWQKYHGLIGKGKEDARQLAIEKWPDAPLELKKHHDRAEALLIAEYGRVQIHMNKWLSEW